VTPEEAWARLLGVARLERLSVLVDAVSPITRVGWIGILTVGDTVTVRVPRDDLVGPLTDALAGLAPADAADPSVVGARLPAGAVVDTLGPAALFYPPAGWSPASSLPAPPAEVDRAELDALLAAADETDLDESGIAESDGPVFGSWTGSGSLAAVAGSRRWPNGVAHLSVYASPEHRNQGHARRAGAAAVAHALDDGLLPQWRARVVASQRVAVAIGLERVGAQLGLQPSPSLR
jgi:RimJ/RimL family protein N-acetyltransferase